MTTVEGLARDDKRGGQILHPVQEAFRECHALQCGFCTPGFLMTIAAGLEKRDNSADLTADFRRGKSAHRASRIVAAAWCTAFLMFA